MNNTEKNLRLCEVSYHQFGYFHCWTNSDRVETLVENGTIKPIGVVSSVFGIVEFEDRVELVKPEEIRFVDETHEMLVGFGNRANTNEKEVTENDHI